MCNKHQTTKQINQSDLESFLNQLNLRTPKQSRNVDVDNSAIATYLEYFTGQSERHANALVSGRIQVGQWLQRMESELYNLQWTMYAIGAGGVQNLDASDVAEINQIVNEQSNFLRRWAAQLRVDEPTNANAITSRANLYGAQAASNTVAIAETRALALPRLPFYPSDRTLCWTNCKCNWRIKALEGNGNFDCVWVLGIAEHCEVCLYRAKNVSSRKPLKVRDGVIVDAVQYRNPRYYDSFYR